MEKSITEKALDGSLLNKLVDPKHFILLSTFCLYWDIFNILSARNGMLHSTFTFGTPFPIGESLVLFASYSLFASVISPFIFLVVKRICWATWNNLPSWFRVIDEDSRKIRSTYYISSYKLKTWAILNNNNLAMDLVKKSEIELNENEKSCPYPFFLSLCLCVDYFVGKNSIIQVLKNSIPKNYQDVLTFSIFIFAGLLAYLSINSISDFDNYIGISPELKKYIENDKNS